MSDGERPPASSSVVAEAVARVERDGYVETPNGRYYITCGRIVRPGEWCLQRRRHVGDCGKGARA